MQRVSRGTHGNQQRADPLWFLEGVRRNGAGNEALTEAWFGCACLTRRFSLFQRQDEIRCRASGVQASFTSVALYTYCVS